MLPIVDDSFRAYFSPLISDVAKGRGRNTSYPVPPAQIPACATNALGSSLEYERQSGNKDGDVII